MPDDGALYRPANGTEGEDFERRWCHRCANDNPDTGDLCPILGAAYFDNQSPKEWIYRAGQGICTSFVPFDDQQPLPEPRCPLTLEMFP